MGRHGGRGDVRRAIPAGDELNISCLHIVTVPTEAVSPSWRGAAGTVSSQHLLADAVRRRRDQRAARSGRLPGDIPLGVLRAAEAEQVGAARQRSGSPDPGRNHHSRDRRRRRRSAVGLAQPRRWACGSAGCGRRPVSPCPHADAGAGRPAGGARDEEQVGASCRRRGGGAGKARRCCGCAEDGHAAGSAPDARHGAASSAAGALASGSHNRIDARHGRPVAALRCDGVVERGCGAVGQRARAPGGGRYGGAAQDGRAGALAHDRGGVAEARANEAWAAQDAPQGDRSVTPGHAEPPGLSDHAVIRVRGRLWSAIHASQHINTL